jgi:DNA-binding XRE family transcriptional regulator
MPAAKNPSAEDRKQARARAMEWRTFRQNYLFSQQYLASTLHCGRRTVCAIENEEVFHPNYDLLRRFRDLKLKQKKAFGQPATPAYSNINSNLYQRGA